MSHAKLTSGVVRSLIDGKDFRVYCRMDEAMNLWCLNIMTNTNIWNRYITIKFRFYNHMATLNWGHGLVPQDEGTMWYTIYVGSTLRGLSVLCVVMAVSQYSYWHSKAELYVCSLSACANCWVNSRRIVADDLRNHTTILYFAWNILAVLLCVVLMSVLSG